MYSKMYRGQACYPYLRGGKMPLLMAGGKARDTQHLGDDPGK